MITKLFLFTISVGYSMAVVIYYSVFRGYRFGILRL